MNVHKQDDQPGGDVILSPKDVRHAIRLLELLTNSENPRSFDVGRGSNDRESSSGLIAVARFWYLVRQGRTEHFSPAMFGEPAWEILLALYLKEAGGAPATVSSLARTAGIPVTTAFRWIEYLEEKRLIARQPSSDDGRASMVTLSDEGRNRLERYFADVLVSMAAIRMEITGDPG